MTLDEDFVKKKLKRLKHIIPGMDTENIEKELFPVSGEEVKPRVGKKKDEK